MVLFIDIDVLIDIRIRGVRIRNVIAIVDGLIDIRCCRRCFSFVIRVAGVERTEHGIVNGIIHLQNPPSSDVGAASSDVGVIRAEIGGRIIEPVLFNEFDGECLIHKTRFFKSGLETPTIVPIRRGLTGNRRSHAQK